MNLLEYLKPGLIFIFLTVLMGSCSKEESTYLPDPELDTEVELRSINITPSGDVAGVTDANAIEQALNDANPGEEVKLEKGIFYINRPIVAPVGFKGKLKGKKPGDDGTRIIAVGSQAAPFGLTTVSNFEFASDPSQEVGLTTMFYFPEPSESLTVSDMELVVDDEFFSEFWTSPPSGPTNALAFMIYVAMGDSEANTTFKNLKLQGTDITPGYVRAEFLPFQPVFGITVSGDSETLPVPQSGGDHKVEKCDFDKMGLRPIEYRLFKDAKIEIKENTITNVKQVLVKWLNGTDVKIENNFISHTLLGGLVVSQEGESVGTDPCKIEIKNNSVETGIDPIFPFSFGAEVGIEIGSATNFDVTIKNNDIQLVPLNNSYPRAGISIGGVDGAKVENNDITGQSIEGIILFGASNCELKGNDLANLTASSAGYTLDDNTNNCTVEIPDNASVLDNGMDNTIEYK